MKQKSAAIKNGLIRASIRLRIPLEKQRDALEILESVCEQTQFEPNCIYARLYRGTNEPETIMLEELWANDQELQRHLESSTYGRILLIIEIAGATPEIRFDKILESNGFETIKAARTKP